MASVDVERVHTEVGLVGLVELVEQVHLDQVGLVE